MWYGHDCTSRTHAWLYSPTPVCLSLAFGRSQFTYINTKSRYTYMHTLFKGIESIIAWYL